MLESFGIVEKDGIPRIRPILLLIFCLSLFAGCATVPDVRSIVGNPYLPGSPPEIVGAEGRLSASERQNVIDAIKRRIESMDILERHAAVMELVGASPLAKDNKATLLIDWDRTYEAMFRASEDARDHIHFETFIIRDDEIGRKLGDKLLRKQSEGVPVHVIYDSVGSIKTSESFFERLRDGGIKVLEFNPIDPLKAGKNWRLVNRDHRKVLIVDGNLAITGGVNIGQEYSSRLSGRAYKAPGKKEWRDTDVQIEKPAVSEFQKLFLDTWHRQKGPPLPERKCSKETCRSPRKSISPCGKKGRPYPNSANGSGA